MILCIWQKRDQNLQAPHKFSLLCSEFAHIFHGEIRFQVWVPKAMRHVATRKELIEFRISRTNLQQTAHNVRYKNAKGHKRKNTAADVYASAKLTHILKRITNFYNSNFFFALLSTCIIFVWTYNTVIFICYDLFYLCCASVVGRVRARAAAAATSRTGDDLVGGANIASLLTLIDGGKFEKLFMLQIWNLDKYLSKFILLIWFLNLTVKQSKRANTKIIFTEICQNSKQEIL